MCLTEILAHAERLALLLKPQGRQQQHNAFPTRLRFAPLRHNQAAIKEPRLSSSASVAEPIDYMLRRWERFSLEIRFETLPGAQAQVDLARFELEFADQPGVTRIVADSH